MTTADLLAVVRLRTRRPRTSWSLAAAAAVLAVMVVLAVAAPLVAPHDPNAVDLLSARQGPSSAHLLGTDGQGRDLLSRAVYGARTSLFGPVLVALIASVVGTFLATVAAWFGGWVNETIGRLLDVLFALPGLLLAIVAVAMFGAGMTVCVLALAISYVPFVARLVHGPLLRARAQPYIAACEIQGFSLFHLWSRRLLPAVAPFMAAQTAVAFSTSLLDLSSLSFLGLGVQPPTADWGVMVASGRQDILQGSPQEALVGCVMIVLTVVAANVLAERLSARSEAGNR